MTRRFLASVSCVVIAAAALAACSNPSRTLGLEKTPPDEFAVAARAPLSIPPEYSLRPPQPGAPRPQEGTTSDQALRAMTGNRVPVQQRTNLSSGERALLSNAGAEGVPSDIRQTVDRETSALAAESESFTDTLVFWRDPEDPATLVEPEAESRRLRENQAFGKSAAEGEMPVIKREKKALLEGIF